MKFGERTMHSGLAPSRMRFYESSGLIRGVERQENGYREYGPEALWTLKVIAGAQSAGFSLDEEIRSLLPNDQTRWQHDAPVAGLERKVAEIEVRQARLAQNKEQGAVARCHRPREEPPGGIGMRRPYAVGAGDDQRRCGACVDAASEGAQ